MCLQEERHAGGDQTRDTLATTAALSLHHSHVAPAGFLLALRGRLHTALTSALRPTELEVSLCVRRDPRAPGCGVTVHSTLPLARRAPWPSRELDGSTFTTEHQ